MRPPCGLPVGVGSFNPRPAVRPGDALLDSIKREVNGCFNPRPAVRPGDADYDACDRLGYLVSIRARP